MSDYNVFFKKFRELTAQKEAPEPEPLSEAESKEALVKMKEAAATSRRQAPARPIHQSTISSSFAEDGDEDDDEDFEVEDNYSSHDEEDDEVEDPNDEDITEDNYSTMMDLGDDSDEESSELIDFSEE